MTQHSYILVKEPNGEYTNVDVADIEQVSINASGEKTIFWKDKDGSKYGWEVDVDHFSKQIKKV